MLSAGCRGREKFRIGTQNFRKPSARNPKFMAHDRKNWMSCFAKLDGTRPIIRWSPPSHM
jgi:hypothetical protein